MRRYAILHIVHTQLRNQCELTGIHPFVLAAHIHEHQHRSEHNDEQQTHGEDNGGALFGQLHVLAGNEHVALEQRSVLAVAVVYLVNAFQMALVSYRVIILIHEFLVVERPAIVVLTQIILHQTLVVQIHVRRTYAFGIVRPRKQLVRLGILMAVERERRLKAVEIEHHLVVGGGV